MNGRDDVLPPRCTASEIHTALLSWGLSLRANRSRDRALASSLAAAAKGIGRSAYWPCAQGDTVGGRRELVRCAAVKAADRWASGYAVPFGDHWDTWSEVAESRRLVASDATMNSKAGHVSIDETHPWPSSSLARPGRAPTRFRMSTAIDSPSEYGASESGGSPHPLSTTAQG